MTVSVKSSTKRSNIFCEVISELWAVNFSFAIYYSESPKTTSPKEVGLFFSLSKLKSLANNMNTK